MLTETIAEFGKTMGLENLSFNEDKTVHLTIESVGELYFEDSEPYLTVYLVNKYENLDVTHMEQALTLCHYRQNNEYRVVPGTYEDNQLLFLTRLTREEVSLPNIEKVINFLHKLHRQIVDLDKK